MEARHCKTVGYSGAKERVAGVEAAVGAAEGVIAVGVLRGPTPAAGIGKGQGEAQPEAKEELEGG